jgi:hypothetical protein
VQPRLERNGDFVVSMTVEARRVEDLNAFMDALEKRSTFRDVLPPQWQTNDEGLIEAVVEGVYVPQTPASAPSPSASPEGAR